MIIVLHSKTSFGPEKTHSRSQGAKRSSKANERNQRPNFQQKIKLINSLKILKIGYSIVPNNLAKCLSIFKFFVPPTQLLGFHGYSAP